MKQMDRHCSSVFNRFPQAVFKMLCHRKIIDSNQNMLTICHSFLMRNRRAMALDDKDGSFIAKSNGRPAVSLLKFGTFELCVCPTFATARSRQKLVSPLRSLEES
jgi:hypothetical protein